MRDKRLDCAESARAAHAVEKIELARPVAIDAVAESHPGALVDGRCDGLERAQVAHLRAIEHDHVDTHCLEAVVASVVVQLRRSLFVVGAVVFENLSLIHI